MPSFDLTDYAARIESDLRSNILAFWIRHVVDHERGTFFGALTNELTVDCNAERGALLTCRILWTFSAAYHRYGDSDYRAMADRAYADLLTNFADGDCGGFYWSIAADGRVLRDRKQVYGQAFAIYALAEYYRSTGEPAALHTAIAVFRLLEKYARDSNYGGYLEAFSRSWQPIADMRLSDVDLNEPKSQNTHLHVMEAYTNLLRVWPDASLRRAQTRLLETMLDRIVNPETCHLGLFFAHDWSLRSDKISYGHDIEAAWLFTEAAEVLGNSSLTARIHPLAVRIADVTLAEGVDADGGIYNEGGPRGLTDTNKEWWPQAEAVVGFLNAYALSHDERHLQAALRCWDFIDQRLIDKQRGEWLRGVTRDGKVLADQLKVSFWKCPYHNGRTGLEAPARLRALARR
ncbi:AGE family epimerase/isomerase [Opitutus terrae]|uniref:Cellobiose 2-epimerase n=1 Tax=Opitutus terrae (strain DSM 11246 / JCM 15787 / PB90-1) TaxID=452637 RepID=B1ZQI2_OPITP|nr:AGE family epimerase/isomerase [Opitutus terrae]ACB75591.1 N-acylglucosamine 2-epimerase [Opitutus terrae PB90-1]